MILRANFDLSLRHVSKRQIETKRSSFWESSQFDNDPDGKEDNNATKENGLAMICYELI